MTILDNARALVITAVVGIIAIVAVVFLVKDIIGFTKGGGASLIQIIGKVAGVILCVALIYMANNFDALGSSISDGTKDIVDTTVTETTNQLSGK